MTTRDSRPRDPFRPETGKVGAREPTQSLSIEPIDAHYDDDEDVNEQSLARGTSEASGDERTRVESPNGRVKTPRPQRAVSRPPPTPAADGPELRIGTVLGSYRLVDLLGKGGMGFVYRAEHIKLGREVALKLLRNDYAARRDAVLRFFQEAKTVNRVRHRNIVDVTDYVDLDDGTTFIIMEYLRGQSLGRWARGGIDLPRALAVLVQICDGLGAAHAVGVIHRDLKPDNVIVVPTSDGAELVKLLDFGVAKLLNREDEDIGFQTAAGSVIGTPAYMSPEQAGGMAIDQRSDIYSLGAIMYELFCGQPMFRGRSFGEFVRKHLTEMPVLPHQTPGGAHIDPRLEALILRCLAKDPNERFGHILELRDGLLHLLGGGIESHPGAPALSQSTIAPAVALQLPPHMLQLPPQPTMSGQVAGVPPSQPSQLLPPSLQPYSYTQYSQLGVAPEPSAPWWVWFVGGALAVGLGIGAALWYANRHAEPAPAAAAPAATPIATPAPQLVPLRFDSVPIASVYAQDGGAALCTTPCTYQADPSDGRRRTFVVRTDGYRDAPIEVDLAGPQRAFRVTLEPVLAPGAGKAAPADIAAPVDSAAGSDGSGAGSGAADEGSAALAGSAVEATHVVPERPHHEKHERGHHVEHHRAEHKHVEPTPPTHATPETHESHDGSAAAPPPTPKPPGSIDPADTLDPFSRSP